jgi:hypothetical protein
VLGGRIGQRLGYRRTLLLGLTGFALATRAAMRLWQAPEVLPTLDGFAARKFLRSDR